jgi:MYXO-CTERM domain-containing protein
MKRSLCLFAALALVLTAAAQSRADTMFWYNWSRNPFSIPFVQQNNQNNAGTGGVNLIDLNSKAIEADATIGTGNPAADIQVISTADASNPDVIKTGGGQYTLTLQIWAKDPSVAANNGQPVGSIQFAGQLFSTGGTTALSANLGNKILSAKDALGFHDGQTFGTVTVGNEQFTVTYSGFAEPGNSNDQTFGAISFHIAGVPAVTGKSPEPSGMVLGFLGLGVLGGVVWRARRRKLAALRAMA